tara:strand:+ start:2291 stop:2563 length:273 start_codon:yes stop_codon:yes gene_type:complete
MEILNWRSMKDELPPDEEFVLLRGDSGYYSTPEFFVLGRRCMKCRPPINGKIRWLQIGNSDLTDFGWEPTHWLPMSEFATMTLTPRARSR